MSETKVIFHVPFSTSICSSLYIVVNSLPAAGAPELQLTSSGWIGLSCRLIWIPNRNVPVKSDRNGEEPDNHPNSVGLLQVWKPLNLPTPCCIGLCATSLIALSFQELALHRGWPPPEYTVLMEAGPPHKREFTVSCRLESLSESGTTHSRTMAEVLEFTSAVFSLPQRKEIRKRQPRSRLQRKWLPGFKVCQAALKSHG